MFGSVSKLSYSFNGPSYLWTVAIQNFWATWFCPWYFSMAIWWTSMWKIQFCEPSSLWTEKTLCKSFQFVRIMLFMSVNIMQCLHSVWGFHNIFLVAIYFWVIEKYLKLGDFVNCRFPFPLCKVSFFHSLFLFSFGIMNEWYWYIWVGSEVLWLLCSHFYGEVKFLLLML